MSQDVMDTVVVMVVICLLGILTGIVWTLNW